LEILESGVLGRDSSCQEVSREIAVFLETHKGDSTKQENKGRTGTRAKKDLTTHSEDFRRRR